MNVAWDIWSEVVIIVDENVRVVVDVVSQLRMVMFGWLVLCMHMCMGVCYDFVVGVVGKM